MHVLRPPIIETVEPDIDIIDEKYQDKDNYTLKNELSDE